MKEIKEKWEGIQSLVGEDELTRLAIKKGFNYVAYHNSESRDLVAFDDRSSGIHFGSRKAADERGEVRAEESYTKKYYLKIDKPYVIEKDFDWEFQSVDIEFMDEEEFSEWRKVYDPHYYLIQNGFKGIVYDNNGNVLYERSIKEMLADKGYDAIIYKNQIEDTGKYSVAMFYPNNIKLAGLTKDGTGNIISFEERFDVSTNNLRY